MRSLAINLGIIFGIQLVVNPMIELSLSYLTTVYNAMRYNSLGRSLATVEKEFILAQVG